MRPCTICNHAQRAKIDAALVSGVSLRALVSKHSGTTVAALHRHRAHLPAKLTKAKEASEAADATTLLAKVRALNDRAIAILDGAQASMQPQVALSAIREARGCLELLGRLSGELQSGNRVQVGVAVQTGAAVDRDAIQSMTDAELAQRIEELLSAKEGTERMPDGRRLVTVEGNELMRGCLTGKTHQSSERLKDFTDTWQLLSGGPCGSITPEALGIKAFIVIGFDFKSGAYPFVQVLGSGEMPTPAPPAVGAPLLLEGVTVSRPAV